MNKSLVFWNKDLSSWIISDYENVKSGLLDKSNFTSDRLKYKKNLWNACKDHKFEGVMNFYKNWLMYMDGPYHQHVRNSIQRAFQTVINNSQNLFDVNLGLIEISSGTNLFDLLIKEYVIQFQEKFFGLPKNEILELHELMNFSVSVLGSNVLNINELRKLEMTLCYLKKKFVTVKNNSSEKGFFRIFFSGNDTSIENISIFLNILLDSLEPLCNLLASITVNYINKKKLRDLSSIDLINRLIMESLRLNPIFLSCNRIAKQDCCIGDYQIRQSQRVCFMIRDANLDEAIFNNPMLFNINRENLNKILSFGFGTHSCLGLFLSKKLGEKYYTNILEKQFKYENYNINVSTYNSIGYNYINSIVVV